MPELNSALVGIAYNFVGRPNRNIGDDIKAEAPELDDAEVHKTFHISSDRLGGVDRAIEDCNRTITLNSNDATAYNNRGITYGEKGDFNKEIEEFSAAIDLKSNHAAAYYNRGLAYTVNKVMLNVPLKILPK